MTFNQQKKKAIPFSWVRIILVSWMFVLTIVSVPAYAKKVVAGKVIIATGKVSAGMEGGEFRKLKRRSKIYVGETVITEAESQTQIRFKDGALISLRENTSFVIGEYSYNKNEQEDKVVMELIKGGFRTITGSVGKGKKDAYEMKTPVASIGIRGTDYALSLNDAGGIVAGVFGGGISVTNDQGSLNLGEGGDFNFSVVNQGEKPQGLLSQPEGLEESTTKKTTSKSEKSEESEEESEEEESEEESEDSEESEEGGEDDKEKEKGEVEDSAEESDGEEKEADDKESGEKKDGDSKEVAKADDGEAEQSDEKSGEGDGETSDEKSETASEEGKEKSSDDKQVASSDSKGAEDSGGDGEAKEAGSSEGGEKQESGSDGGEVAEADSNEQESKSEESGPKEKVAAAVQEKSEVASSDSAGGQDGGDQGAEPEAKTEEKSDKGPAPLIVAAAGGEQGGGEQGSGEQSGGESSGAESSGADQGSAQQGDGDQGGGTSAPLSADAGGGDTGSSDSGGKTLAAPVAAPAPVAAASAPAAPAPTPTAAPVEKLSAPAPTLAVDTGGALSGGGSSGGMDTMGSFGGGTGGGDQMVSAGESNSGPEVEVAPPPPPVAEVAQIDCYDTNDQGQSECDGDNGTDNFVEGVANGIDTVATTGVIEKSDALEIVVTLNENSDAISDEVVLGVVEDVFEGDDVVEAIVVAVKSGDVEVKEAITTVEVVRGDNTDVPPEELDANREEALGVIGTLSEQGAIDQSETITTVQEAFEGDEGSELVDAIIEGVESGNIELGEALDAVDTVSQIDDAETLDTIKESIDDGNLDIDEAVNFLDNVAAKEGEEVTIPDECLADPQLCAGEVQTEAPQECIDNPETCIQTDGGGFVVIGPQPGGFEGPQPEFDISLVPIPAPSSFVAPGLPARLNIGMVSKLVSPSDFAFDCANDPNCTEPPSPSQEDAQLCAGDACIAESLANHFAKLSMGPAVVDRTGGAPVVSFSPFTSAADLINTQQPPSFVFQKSVGTPVQNFLVDVGGFDVTWGRWMGSPQNPVLVRNTFTDIEGTQISYIDIITEQVLFATVSETDISQLVGIVAYKSTPDFILNTSDGGNNRVVSSSFNIDFNNNAIFDGQMNIGDQQNPMFRFRYNGFIDDSAAQMFIVSSEDDLINGNAAPGGILGSLNGVFTGEEGVAFLQGFSVHDSLNGTTAASGYVLLEQDLGIFLDPALVPIPLESAFTQTGFIAAVATDQGGPGDPLGPFDNAPSQDTPEEKLVAGLATEDVINGRPTIAFSEGADIDGDPINNQFPPDTVLIRGFDDQGNPGIVQDFRVNIAGHDITWGRWNADLSSPVLARQKIAGSDVVNAINEEVLFATVNAFDTNQLVGTASFSSVDNHILVTGDGLNNRNVSSIFDVNFDTGAISNGHLVIGEFSNPMFSVFFSGSVDRGHAALGIDSNASTLINNAAAPNGVAGDINGTFAAPDGNAFLEGFSLFDPNNINTSAAGFVVLERQ